MNCATSTLKFVVFIFNVLCAIVGLITIIICSLAIRTLEQDHLTYCIAGIVVGTIAFIVSFFGCCGAYREVSGFMWTYAVLLAVLLIVQLAIFITFHSKDFIRIATDDVEKLWQAEINGVPGSMTDFETRFECCGLHGPKDYPAANLTIPTSCYTHNENTTDDHLFEVGCLERAANIYAYASKVIKATNWTLCGIEGMALIFACILARSFRRHSHSVIIPTQATYRI